MPPPTMTTSYCFMASSLRKSPREIALGCLKTAEHTTFGHLSPFAHRDRHAAALGVDLALFLELEHGRARSHFDLTIDDGALGDRNGLGADLAADDGGVADFEFAADGEAPRDGAGDDGLLRANEAMPGAARGQSEAALQVAVA